MIDEKYSKWKAKLPGQLITLEWKAEIVKEVENRFLGWSSLPDSTVDNAGKVVFNDAHGGTGTELDITITYHHHLGVIGAGISKLLNPVFEKMVRTDLQNLKVYLETGSLPD
jgi:uncharacterized membrane protein